MNIQIQELLEKKKTIQTKLIKFIDDSIDIEENYQNLINILNDQNIFEQKNEIKEFLQLISKISNNHFRFPNFFSKIERILSNFKDKISENFSNIEIFKLFHSNKRILLYLIEENVIQINSSIFNIMNDDKNKKFNYIEYFYLEVKSFLNNRLQKEIESKLFKEFNENNIESFKRKRKEGENDDFICNMIRNDLIDDFISFVNQKNYMISSKINSSIYETNPYLIENNDNITLIEYSAFFGSIQIFKYIFLNNKKFNISNLFIYAIHGDNPEIIHLLERLKIKNIIDIYKMCFLESIKCHHNEIANYIESNYLNGLLNNDENFVLKSLKYRNYCYFPNNLCSEKVFFWLCKYNYVNLVDFLLKTLNLIINIKII